MKTDPTPHPAGARSRSQILAQLLETLERDRGVPAETLGRLDREARARKTPLERLLVERRLVDEADLLGLLAEITRFPLVQIAETPVDPQAVSSVPARVAVEYRLIPLEVRSQVITLASDQVHDLATEDDLRILLGRSIRWALCSARDVSECIKHFYGVAVETFLGLDKPAGAAADANPDMSNFVRRVIADAMHSRATDIHFEPQEDHLQLRYRIDGVLYPIPLPRGADVYHRAIASSTKVIAQLNIAERRLPQDGRFSLAVDGDDLDVRVSILPTPYGESVNLRILNRSSTFLRMDELGLPEAPRRALDHLLSLPHGIVLFTGPTGSGKTTSLYAALARLNDNQRKIITVEDPIEYRVPGITQMQANPEIGFTFANGLRSILRHDPDVILIGEIRDQETAGIAINAALTGHLVFSTLHTNDSAAALTRLVNIGIEPYLVSSSVQGVVAQRLVRRICAACREHRPAEPAVSDLIRREAPGSPPLERIALGRGCPECRFTGYAGRRAIFEILTLNDTLRALVTARAPSTEIHKRAVGEGMQTLRQSGWQCVLEGGSTVEDILRLTPGGAT